MVVLRLSMLALYLQHAQMIVAKTLRFRRFSPVFLTPIDDAKQRMAEGAYPYSREH